MLLNYHIRRIVLSSLCVGELEWLGLSSARVAGTMMHGPINIRLLIRAYKAVRDHNPYEYNLLITNNTLTNSLSGEFGIIFFTFKPLT